MDISVHDVVVVVGDDPAETELDLGLLERDHRHEEVQQTVGPEHGFEMLHRVNVFLRSLPPTYYWLGLFLFLLIVGSLSWDRE